MAFTHLHLHTEYSLLDGAIRIKDLPSRLKSLGMTSCAVTDHGVMYGAIDFYLALEEAGIKPIIGAEVYVVAEGRLVREKGQAFSHLILLAENNTGLKNLNKIVSQGFIDGFYYKPRVDYSVLRDHSEGLIALSSCLSGEVPRALLKGDIALAKEKALNYVEIFGKDNFFLEVQANGMPEQNKVNRDLRKLGEELGIPLVATNDCHYLLEEDAAAHDALLCMQTGKKLQDPDRMRMGARTFYLKSEDEMRRDLPDFSDAIDNTALIADRCQVTFDFSTIHLPKFEAPDHETSEAFMRRMALEGLEKRLERPHREDRETYMKRFDHEFSIIRDMGFVDYYLIVWDFIRYAKDHQIMVGPGRGSGAGSLIAYCLGITNIDPLEYNLLFERFLNVDRVSMPDFDIDFCYERRQEVIDYVVRKYGESRVCQVITFGTLAAKAGIRDVGRVLDMPYQETDRLSKMVPNDLGMTLDLALERNPELAKLYQEDPKVREVYDLARKFEGMPRHTSTHAAGVIISSEEITDIAPVSRNDDALVVQYAKENIERLGLLKFDFLGLRTLTVLRDSRDMILENHGIEVDFEALSLQDPEVYKMLQQGKTSGVFQLESQGMTSFMKELKPENFEDIIAGIALYRPGPMEQIPRYVEARHDPSKIHYHHPSLEPLLNMTYGTIIYQEQVMQIVRNLGGFSMGQADIVRRAMAKKKPDLLASYEEQFIFGGQDDKGRPIDGCIKRGVDEKTGRLIFKELMAFAGYAFNKSHAAAYALVAYYTAWLKYYYPVELMAAMLNSYLGDLGQAANYVNTCKDMGIPIYPPDVNYSEARFVTEGGGIRFALGAVKNVGIKQIDLLAQERRTNGKFESYGDFLRRAYAIGVSRKSIESLIYASALDGFGEARARLMSALEPYYDMLSQSKSHSMEGQISFLDLGQEEAMEIKEPTYLDVDEYSRSEKLAKEKEMLGIYVTGHPLEDYRKTLESQAFVRAVELNPPPAAEGDIEDPLEQVRGPKVQDQQEVLMGGMVIRKRTITTKRNELMAFLVMEDLTGEFEVVVFPKVLAQYNAFIQEGNILQIKGRVSTKEDFPNSILLNEVQKLETDANNERVHEEEPIGVQSEVRENLNSDNTFLPGTDLLVLNVPGPKREEADRSLFALCKFWQGDLPVLLFYEADKSLVALPDWIRVETHPKFLQELIARYGINNIWIGQVPEHQA